MKTVWTIFKKEMRKFFTDPRMLSALFLPGILIFILYSFMGNMINTNIIDTSVQNTTYKIAYTDNFSSKGNETPIIIQGLEAYIKTDNELNQSGNNAEYYKIKIDEVNETKSRIKSGEFHILIEFSNDFEDFVFVPESTKKSVINIFYNGEDKASVNLYSAANALVAPSYNNYLLNFDIDNNVDVPANLNSEDYINKTIIAFVFPMVTISLLFSTVMSICPETIAGEKERGTLASVLITPTRRSDIIIGKIGALTLTGFLSAIVSFTGLLTSLPSMYGGHLTMDAGTIAGLFFVITTGLVLFVSVGLLISTLVSSVKEANGYLSPMMVILMLLALFPSFIDMSNIGFAFVPFLNICTTMNLLINGSLNPLYLVITIVINLVTTGLIVLVAAKLFNNEKIIFSK